MSSRDDSQEPGGSLFEEKRLSRARFLRMLGAGVGVSLVLGSLAGFGGGEVAGAQMTGGPTILADGTYPIGIWWPPPPSQTTTQRYQEIAAAGFNFVIGGNGVTNDTYNPTALNAAGSNNLRYVLSDSNLMRLIHDNASEGEVRIRIDQLLQRYGGYPALTGLALRDEPNRAMFEIIGYARGYLQTKNSKLLTWANVLPWTTNQAQMGASTYDEYLGSYLSVVKPAFLSFDHYPLVSDTAITAGYFDNWAIIRRYSLQAGVPSWAFIQSVDFKWNDNSLLPRRRPNEAELFWQVNVSLAYGAKGIQYFTYWTPNDNATVTFGEAVVSKDGRLTALYDYAKRVNSYLRVVGNALLPLTSESVVHANEHPLPRGTTAFSVDGWVASTGGSPAILSKFRKPATEIERHLLVANRWFSGDPVSTQLKLDASVIEISELDSSTGTFTQVAQKEPGQVEPLQLTVQNDPGRARLYLLKKSGSSDPPPDDTEAPTVTSTTPTSSQTGVARNTDLTIVFSEEMDPDTLSTSTVTLHQKYWYRVRKRVRGKIRRVWRYRWVPVTASVSCDTPCKTATLDPSSDLLANTTYWATVATGAKDKAGSALAQNYSWTFTTGSA